MLILKLSAYCVDEL